jgi:hypothetical protein
VLRCRELAVWANFCRQPLSGAPAISVALSASCQWDVPKSPWAKRAAIMPPAGITQTADLRSSNLTVRSRGLARTHLDITLSEELP